MRTEEYMRSKRWSAEEYEYLKEQWGNVSIPTISKRLGRSIEAVKLKARRLKLGPFLNNGTYITLNQLAQAVTGNRNYSYKMISWVEKRGLPVHKKKTENCNFLIVYIDEFWKWAERNRSFIDFSKMEPLILGKEPEWVEEQRRKDFKAGSLNRKKVWTQSEDKRLRELLKQQKYTWSELSEILCRTNGAIQRRCTDLGIKDRPVKADNHGENARWTDSMNEAVVNGILSGDSYAVIGKKIGKSEKAVRGKAYQKYHTENADKIREIIIRGE